MALTPEKMETIIVFLVETYCDGLTDQRKREMITQYQKVYGSRIPGWQPKAIALMEQNHPNMAEEFKSVIEELGLME